MSKFWKGKVCDSRAGTSASWPVNESIVMLTGIAESIHDLKAAVCFAIGYALGSAVGVAIEKRKTRKKSLK